MMSSFHGGRRQETCLDTVKSACVNRKTPEEMEKDLALFPSPIQEISGLQVDYHSFLPKPMTTTAKSPRHSGVENQAVHQCSWLSPKNVRKK